MNYPFSPEVLDALPEAIAERYRQLEADLINEICSRLKISGQLNQVAVEAIKALRSHGISLKEIKAAISKQTGISLDELDKLLAEVVERNNVYYNGLATAADVTAPEVWLSAREIDAIARQTKNELENITQSMGFAVRVNGRVTKLLDGAEAYRWALDRATMKVRSGVVSYNQAIADAVKELADGGMKTVRYDSNGKVHYDHIDVAARRAVMTGVSQICSKYSEQAAEQLGTNLVEVSAHIGARDTGIGPENHKEWQGKVYHWVKDGEKQNPKYKDFIRTTGYGTGEGLYGWNCRHSFYPFIEGVSERTWTDEQLAHIDDGHEVGFEGKKYTAYEATQKQRMIERTMRKLKRERDAYKSAGLEDDARNSTIRLRRLSKKYKDFSAAADLPEQRERIKGYVQGKETPTENIKKVSEESKKALPKGDIKSVENSPIRATMLKTDGGSGVVHKVGKIDLEKFRVVSENIRTDEVVITSERIEHIKEHHPDDYERFSKYIQDMIEKPQYILEANKPNTAFVLKQYTEDGKQFELILRLAVEGDTEGYKNSVITFLKISERKWKKYLRNKKILYKNE